MLDETGCDAVMIGRGVLGNPWLIRDSIDFLEKGSYNSKLDLDEKINMLKKHLKYFRIV